MGDVRFNFVPNPRQREFFQCPAQEILYGGAAGGGKTDALIAAGVTMCLLVPGAKVILFRQTYPELEQEIIPRMQAKIPAEMARWRGKDYSFRFPNGSIFRLGHLATDTDVTRYQGPEYQLVLWDELTHFTRYQYTYLRSRLRASGAVLEAMNKAGLKPRMLAGTNPGGRGHDWVKTWFVDPSPGSGVPFLGGTPEDRPQARKRWMAFVPAKVTDNPAVDQAEYVAGLESMDEDLTRALLDGDWDLMGGVRFSQFRRGVHVIDPALLPLPEVGYTRAVGADYGTADAFAAVWGALLPDNLVVIYREAYETGITSSEQANLIRALESDAERAPGRPIPVALDPSAWNRNPEQPLKSPDPRVPARGSIAWFYWQVFGEQLVRAQNDRVSGAGLIDHHLKVRGDGLPRILIYSSCTRLIKTLPALMRSKTNPNDVGTSPKQDDHLYDALRYCLMQLVGRGTGQATPLDAATAERERMLTAGVQSTQF